MVIKSSHVDLPHNSIDHLHDDLINDREEINHRLSLLSKGAQDSSKGQAEEDYSKGVRSGSEKITRPIRKRVCYYEMFDRHV